MGSRIQSSAPSCLRHRLPSGRESAGREPLKAAQAGLRGPPGPLAAVILALGLPASCCGINPQLLSLSDLHPGKHYGSAIVSGPVCSSQACCCPPKTNPCHEGFLPAEWGMQAGDPEHTLPTRAGSDTWGTNSAFSSCGSSTQPCNYHPTVSLVLKDLQGRTGEHTAPWPAPPVWGFQGQSVGVAEGRPVLEGAETDKTERMPLQAEVSIIKGLSSRHQSRPLRETGP